MSDDAIIDLLRRSPLSFVGTIENLGAATMDLGSGDDTFTWGLDADDFVTANQSVKLLGGLGIDVFDQKAAPNVFVLPPTLTSLEVQLP